MSEKPTYSLMSGFLDDVACERIYRAICQVLETTGCLVKAEKARELLVEAGCTAEGELVRIPAAVLARALESVPKDTDFALYDRDGNRAFGFAPGEVHFGPTITTVHFIDPETGEKRHGTRADAVRTATLVDRLENIEYASAMAGIFDGVPAATDLYELQAVLENTNKPVLFWAATPQNLAYEFEMFTAISGSMEAFAEKPFGIALVCPIDPLIHTEEGCDQLIEFARAKVPVVYISGSSMGSTSPITIPGALVVGMADTLVGLVISQLAQPGAPFVASKFSDNVDMKKVSTYHSGPEFVTLNAWTADFCRYLRLPFCLNYGDSDSGTFDQVAAFDAAAQIQAAILAGSNMNFASGALDNGLISAYAPLVYNNEIIGYFRKLYAPIGIDEESLQLDSIDAMGPGGSYLTEDCTLDNYQDMWASPVFCPRAFDEVQGAPDGFMDRKLTDYALDLIAQGPLHPLDGEAAAKIDAIVARAEAELS